MKSKIQEIKEITQWTNPQTNKVIYYHTLVMENEDTIQLGKMQDHAFKIDQEVEYEPYMKDGKQKWREKSDFVPGGTRKEDQFTSMIILAQSSTHRAVELINAGLLLNDGSAYELPNMETLIGRLMDIQIKLAKERI